MIFDSTTKYIDDYSDWYIVYMWIEILYLSILNPNKYHYDQVSSIVIPLFNKHVKLCRGEGKGFDLNNVLIKKRFN